MKDFLPEDELIETLQDLNPVLDHSRRNLIIDCPCCGERECSISLNKGHKWGCFRLKKCGERGNIWKILKLIGKLSEKINKNAVSNYIDIRELFNNRPQIDENSIDFTKLEDLPTIPKPFGWERTFNDEYLNQRGFISYNSCHVGRTKLDPLLKNNYVIFLVKESDEIKGYVSRHVWNKNKITEYNNQHFIQTGIKNKIKRYRNSETDFSKLLYGYDEIDESNVLPVCLVEGIFDKHAVDSKLMLNQNRFMYCCATFKAFISDDQIVKLKIKGVTDIILFYDPDVIKQIQRNVIKLSKYFNLKVIISDINKDPDEMSQDELIRQFADNQYNYKKILIDFMQTPT